MPVLRKNHQGNFTPMPNEVLQSKSLSLRARGLLGFMLSKPQDWNFSHKALLSELPSESKGSIQASINELTKSGYVQIIQERKNGRLGKATWYVSDTPYPNIRDAVTVDTPYPGIPDSGKSTSYKRKNIKKKEAVPAVEGGTQLAEGYYLDPESEKWRRRT